MDVYAGIKACLKTHLNGAGHFPFPRWARQCFHKKSAFRKGTFEVALCTVGKEHAAFNKCVIERTKDVYSPEFRLAGRREGIIIDDIKGAWVSPILEPFFSFKEAESWLYECGGLPRAVMKPL